MTFVRSKPISEGALRRKFPRRKFARKLGILFDGQYWMGEGIELGEGGLGVVFGQQLPVGKRLVVNFQLPGGVFVSTQAEIKNCKSLGDASFSVGLAFVALKFEFRRGVRTYVADRVASESV